MSFTTFAADDYYYYYYYYYYCTLAAGLPLFNIPFLPVSRGGE